MAPLGSWLCPEPGVAALPAPPPAGPAAGAPGTWTRAQPPRGKMLRSGEERGEQHRRAARGASAAHLPCGALRGGVRHPTPWGAQDLGGFPPLCCRCDVGRASQGSRRLQTPGAGLWGTPGSQEAMDGLKRVAQARAELGMVADQLSASLLCSRQGKAAQRGGSPGPVLGAELSMLSTGCPKQKTQQLFPRQPHRWVTPRPQSFPKTSPSAGHCVLVARVPSAPSSARRGEQAGSP